MLSEAQTELNIPISVIGYVHSPSMMLVGVHNSKRSRKDSKQDIHISNILKLFNEDK